MDRQNEAIIEKQISGLFAGIMKRQEQIEQENERIKDLSQSTSVVDIDKVRQKESAIDNMKTQNGQAIQKMEELRQKLRQEREQRERQEREQRERQEREQREREEYEKLRQEREQRERLAVQQEHERLLAQQARERKERERKEREGEPIYYGRVNNNNGPNIDQFIIPDNGAGRQGGPGRVGRPNNLMGLAVEVDAKDYYAPYRMIEEAKQRIYREQVERYQRERQEQEGQEGEQKNQNYYQKYLKYKQKYNYLKKYNQN
jgi:hypothetical protein